MDGQIDRDINRERESEREREKERETVRYVETPQERKKEGDIDDTKVER